MSGVHVVYSKFYIILRKSMYIVDPDQLASDEVS